MIEPRWYRRPQGEGVVLRKAPLLASWNKSTDPDQVRLREYLEDTAQLVTPHRTPDGPWALLLEVGLPTGRDLVDMADLDNYAFPLATRLRDEDLVTVWCTKRHADTSRVLVAPAHETTGPSTYTVRTTASATTTAYKEQVRSAVVDAAAIPDGPVQLQLAFVVGPKRNWLTLWKPTIDALDPLLGRTREDRDWHPRDGRITDLGLHVAVDPLLGHDIVVGIAAAPATAPSCP